MPGRFIVLVGPDGVGKTSVARALLERSGLAAAYFHFIPPLRGPLLGSLGPAPPPPAKSISRGWRLVGWLRLLRNGVRCWMGYLGTVRPWVRKNRLVVGDRWLYGYIVQPYALKFYGPDWFARAIVGLLPRPHLVANLSAPPSVIHARKKELTLEQIEHELEAWSGLDVAHLHTFDATLPPEHIADEILQWLASDVGRA